MKNLTFVSSVLLLTCYKRILQTRNNPIADKTELALAILTTSADILPVKNLPVKIHLIRDLLHCGSVRKCIYTDQLLTAIYRNLHDILISS